MAKRRRQHVPPDGLQIPPTTNKKDSCAQRLSNLAIELGLAGAQVLREHFDFDEAQANEWLDKTVARAQRNRETG